MRLLAIIFFIFATQLTWAQGAIEREHPRVSELQDKLTEYARGYLQTRLQDIPFMVTVKIDALRRSPNSNYQPQRESLPYYDIVAEEIVDEWDDPSASLYVLQSRISKATVLISLPKALKPQEVQEIRDTLMTLLRLIPGRDDIKIELRDWTMPNNWLPIAGISLASLFLLLLGSALITRQWSKRLSAAIQEVKPKVGADSDGQSAEPMKLPDLGLPGGAKSSGSGDLKFRDPLKTREFVALRVSELVRHQAFPNLAAMIEMQKLVQSNPRDLGALLMEFPLEKQKHIFGLSFSSDWLTAFTDPGEISGQSLELLDRLCRIQYDDESVHWENLLICAWRLDVDLAGFLKILDKDEAFAILKDLPSSIAVPVAREAFPGGWARILDTGAKFKRISKERIQELATKLTAVRELNDFSDLEKYRHEKDLLVYLKMATPMEEKDVYSVIDSGSFLWKVRPPFYRIFDASPEGLKVLVNQFSIDEWALALFNSPRESRKPIEALFNSKQRFLFLNRLKMIDQSGVDKLLMGEVREKIAKTYHRIQTEDAFIGQMEEVKEDEIMDNAA